MAKRNADNMPATDPGNDSRDEQAAYNPFLKAADVSEQGETFGITAGFTRRRPGMYGEQIVMEVTRESDHKTFDFAIGVGSINHRILARKLGDESGWQGRVTLRAETMTRGRAQGNKMIAVVAEPPIPF